MAVNTILAAAGEQPIASLSSDASVSSKIAENMLQEATNNVLATGWYFNTRTRVELVPNVQGEIEVAEDIIRIDTQNYWPEAKYTIRSGKIYNASEGVTTGFSDPLIVDIVYYLEWDDIPETVRLYITKKAARLYVTRFVSDPNLLRAVVADEAEAQINMQREDIATSNSRIFGDEFSRIIDRGKPLDWVS